MSSEKEKKENKIRGPGRPRIYQEDRKICSLNLSNSAKNRLEQLANERGLSMSEMVNILILGYNGEQDYVLKKIDMLQEQVKETLETNKKLSKTLQKFMKKDKAELFEDLVLSKEEETQVKKSVEKYRPRIEETIKTGNFKISTFEKLIFEDVRKNALARGKVIKDPSKLKALIGFVLSRDFMRKTLCEVDKYG